MTLTTVQAALVWHAARGLGLTLTGAEVVEVANREHGLSADLAQAREQIARLTADLAAERERNAPLRARIKALQDQHDADTAGLRTRLAYLDDLWDRASSALTTQEAGGWTALPSACERATWSVLTAERDALAVAGNAMAEAINDGVREMPRGGATGGGWPNDPGRRMREALDRWRALAPAATTVREDDRP